MRVFFIFLFITSSFLGFSQSLKPKDQETLRTRMQFLINDYRNSNGIEPLEFNEILRKAAQNQSDYMAKSGKLDHGQKKSSMNSPIKRVKYFKGKEFMLIGENIASNELSSDKLSGKIIEAVCQEIFKQWKDSPEHNKNMLNAEYQFGDFGFAFNETKKTIYATNVFAKNKVKIEGQISSNAFGITKDEVNCSKLLDDYWNILATIGNSLEVEGNEVVLYYHDLKLFTEILSGPTDGIAVDLIAQDQLLCGSSNQLDGSPVYDGIMLKPTFIGSILKNNRSESPYRVKSVVGIIPEYLPEKAYQPSLILIKNNKACFNFNLIYVPTKRLEVIPYTPILKNPDGQLVNEGIIETDKVEFTFHSDNIYTEQPISYKKKDNLVHSMKIYSYSSVDGKTEHNSYLHKERAKYIQNTLQKTLGNTNFPITTFSDENWRMMYFQLEYNLMDSIANFSKDSIKNYLSSKNDKHNWSTELNDQRKSFALINYYGKLSSDDDTSAFLTMNLRTALAQNNVNLVNKVLYLLYHQKTDLSEVIFEDLVYEELLKNPDLVQNASAVMSKYCANHLYEITAFAAHWIRQKNTLTTDAKNNLLHLYSLTGLEIIDKWDVSTERLARVLHPSKVKELTGNFTPNELLLNVNLVFIEYFGQINDSPNIVKAFEFVSNYFSKVDLSTEQETDLVLFFNNWSMFQLTVDFLLPKFKSGDITEEQLFILAHTLNLNEKRDGENELMLIHKKAIEVNKVRWCEWIDLEFLLLHNIDIKDLFCQTCY